MPQLLIELFSEEIPARMQVKARENLQKLITNGVVDAGLTYESAATFSTPRRLALVIDGLSLESKSTREERKGPSTSAPDKAVDGFARSTGLARDQLEIRETPKGDAYFAVIETPSKPASEIVSEVLEATIRNFPWPKSMRWGTGSLRWVRPLHSILCIMSDEAGHTIVPVDIDGIRSADLTAGHRFLSEGSIGVANFDDYEAKLKAAHVILRSDVRAEMIASEAQTLAFAQGLELVEDASMLEEVSGLVEWPVVLIGEIGEDFLTLPPEVLQTSMREHQKFFSVKDTKTGQIVRFVTVANMQTADQGATILAGNQKVLAARLSDAKFFWENDLRVAKAGMQPWLEALDNVTFHNKLGSQADRIKRIEALAREIAPATGADPDEAAMAARLAKADLSSEMVYEFPELQGTMGKYYAEASGNSTEVAAVAEDHYSPLGPSDDVPTAPLSVSVALADKIDTLTGFWAIDEKPTGSKDPFALRRAALGVVRLVLENELTLGLITLFDTQIVDLGGGDDTGGNLLSFIHDRLKVYLKDQGIRHDVIDACIAMPDNDDILKLTKRAKALQAFLATDDGENLIQGYKRASNILAQAEDKDGVEYSFGADRKYAKDAGEITLFDALDVAEPQVKSALSEDDFAGALQGFAGLRAATDTFFTSVQVNADEQVLRRNRLNLLSQIRKLGLEIADLTKIEG